MSAVEPGSVRSGLVDRVRAILTRPTDTWDIIDTEPATIEGLYKGYVMLLAAIPAVCSLIGMLVFGIGFFGISFRPSPIWAVVQAIVHYVLSLAMVYVLALVIDSLAPNFGGTKDRIQAFKLAAYAPTASWVAGVFSLLPMLAILGIVGGIYSLYTLFKGLPKLMKSPEDRAGPYFVVVLVVTIVIALVIGMVESAITRIGVGPMGLASAGRVSGTMHVPGASVDLARLEAASKRAELAAKQMQDGKAVAATNPDVLKGYLPGSVAGYARGDVSASSGGSGAVQGSEAEATYSRRDATLRLAVTDMGGAGALAGMANAFNVNASKETSTGYEKVGRVDGRMTTERYDRDSKHGEYSVLVGDRFVIAATGDGVSMDDLKAAVNAVGATRLEGLAKASY